VREYGTLIDASDRKQKSYEAVWRVGIVAPKVCVVLVLRRETAVTEAASRPLGVGGAPARGMVVRVGGLCQGVMIKSGNEVTAERWERSTQDAKWNRVTKVGNDLMPCSVACLDRDESPESEKWQGARYWKEAIGLGFDIEKTVFEGDMVCVGKWEWEVVERCHW
jgi:hypothetical protein